ncbi:MAG: hypothetical protein COU51_00625 [Parcubacteria group bacterium CG10_big_fil_rev_8_21_14_0_10_36_14]|nr:MAG: hypothetical protein COU51_00625 [Parcubacteria group bacterium CG10_big_fil_rev_8_21_14_0_10_36_14]
MNEVKAFRTGLAKRVLFTFAIALCTAGLLVLLGLALPGCGGDETSEPTITTPAEPTIPPEIAVLAIPQPQLANLALIPCYAIDTARIRAVLVSPGNLVVYGLTKSVLPYVNIVASNADESSFARAIANQGGSWIINLTATS